MPDDAGCLFRSAVQHPVYADFEKFLDLQSPGSSSHQSSDVLRLFPAEKMERISSGLYGGISFDDAGGRLRAMALPEVGRDADVWCGNGSYRIVYDSLSGCF